MVDLKANLKEKLGVSNEAKEKILKELNIIYNLLLKSKDKGIAIQLESIRKLLGELELNLGNDTNLMNQTLDLGLDHHNKFFLESLEQTSPAVITKYYSVEYLRDSRVINEEEFRIWDEQMKSNGGYDKKYASVVTCEYLGDCLGSRNVIRHSFREGNPNYISFDGENYLCYDEERSIIQTSHVWVPCCRSNVSIYARDYEYLKTNGFIDINPVLEKK